jgi:hypothetical protein
MEEVKNTIKFIPDWDLIPDKPFTD